MAFEKFRQEWADTDIKVKALMGSIAVCAGCFLVHQLVQPDRTPAHASAAVKSPASQVRTQLRDLPGMPKIETADRDLPDPTRVQKIFWRNGDTERVNVSATQVNRIQLPFNNPSVVATADVAVQQRAASNNVYVTFNAEHSQPVQMWLEMPGGGPAAVGLELVPTAVPAQTVVVIDDTPASVSKASPTSRQSESDALSHAHSLLQDAALGGALDRVSVIDFELPMIGGDGLAVVAVFAKKRGGH